MLKLQNMHCTANPNVKVWVIMWDFKKLGVTSMTIDVLNDQVSVLRSFQGYYVIESNIQSLESRMPPTGADPGF